MSSSPAPPSWRSPHSHPSWRASPTGSSLPVPTTTNRGVSSRLFVVLTPESVTKSISGISRFPDLHVNNSGELTCESFSFSHKSWCHTPKKKTQDWAVWTRQIQCRVSRPETENFHGEPVLDQTGGGGGYRSSLQETGKVRKRITLVFSSQRDSHSCRHDPENVFVVPGGHVNLRDTGTSLRVRNVVQDVFLVLWYPLRLTTLRFSEVTRTITRHTTPSVTDSGGSKTKYVMFGEVLELWTTKRLILECRCDERLKTKAEGSTRLAHTGWSVSNRPPVVYYYVVCLLRSIRKLFIINGKVVYLEH